MNYASLGIRLGLRFTLLCWFGNLKPTPQHWHLISTFLDLLSLIAVPMLVTATLNALAAQQEHISRRALDMKELVKSGRSGCVT